MIIVCGRYEGVDERIIMSEIDEEWSIGDYVLSGGEFAALVLIDSVCRLLPGVLGDNNSANEDSFVDGLLDYPHYTRPDDINGLTVPDAKEKIVKEIERKKIGKKKITFRLKDWGVSRQRYWGCPIPMLYLKSGKVVPVDKSDLPVKLP